MQSKRINFAMVIHNHQPVDNDPDIVEEVYRRSYLPFLKALYEFPLVKANLHYSGYLLEWIEREHPEFIDLLREMVSRKQVELLGGAYYEAILPVIPDADAEGQVALLREKISYLFGREPEGFWTAERAWEPQSPEVLHASGVKYTVLDDTMLMSSGIGAQDCLHPYLVESRGSSVTVFPMMKRLRYLIPWKSEHRTISFLRRNADYGGSSLAVFGDDGEKFGSWPTTYETVYKRGWLDNFLKLVTRNHRWLRTVTLSEYLAEFGAHQRAYLASEAYDEIMNWSLPATSADKETKERARGFWRLYLSKYPEGGRLYARMLSVSKAAHGVEDDDTRAKILHELWKGQFNDVYWHGVFGGLYSATLRRIAYHHIIQAQTLTESATHGAEDWLEVKDEDVDGNLEYSINTRSVGVRLCPSAGGSLSELDFKGPAINVLDVLSRRKEAYHYELRASSRRPSGLERPAARDARLRELLIYDRHPRFSFQDFLVEDDTTVENFVHQDFSEISGLAGEPYGVDVQTDEKTAVFALSQTKALGGSSLKVKKSLRVPAQEPAIVFSYQVSQGSGDDEELEGKFAVEINISSLGDRSFIKRYSRPARYASSVGGAVEYPEIGMSLSLEFSRQVELFEVPIVTVSRSEAGFESNLQGVSLIPNFEMPKTSTSSDLEIRLSLRSGSSDA
jgi:4-alpha-glucanotransferase